MDVYATTTLPAEIGAMATEAESEGFRFVTRLVAEWAQGENRFDRDGEILFIARDDGRVVGVCGVNVDPYADSAGIARLRHLYVTLSSRRTGIGRALVAAAVRFARSLGYRSIRLRTHDAGAAAFYEACGFTRTRSSSTSTHELELSTARAAR